MQAIFLPVRVNFLLYEFSNLPAIPHMPAMINTARSRNIKFHLIIQGMYQLSSKYGSDDAQTIKENYDNWAFLTSRKLPRLREISELCGEDAQTRQKLISVSQLQLLSKWQGKILILLGHQPPYLAHLADISEYVLPVYDQPRLYPCLPGKYTLPVRTIKDVLAAISLRTAGADEILQDLLDDLLDD